MVRELGEGTLDEEPFRYWVRQDYVSLVEYSRVFAHGAALLPCTWGFNETGQRLDARGRPDDERFRRRFRTSVQYEYLFWDAARHQRAWPV